jgi:type I restriction enzyme S subunit
LAGQGKTRGTAAFLQKNMAINQSLAALVVNGKADAEFLFYVMEENYDSLREVSSGDGGRGGLNKKLLKKFAVSIPSNVCEQKSIAETLSCMDEHIANLTELIEKKKGIRDGALEDLVSGRTRLKGVDIVWEETELGRISSYRKGRTSSQKKHYISTENMRQEFAGITPYSGSYTVDGCEFSEGDTLLANIRPYLKKIWYADFSGCCSADVLVVHPNDGIASKYIYYIVANDRYINYVMNGGTKGIKMPRGDKKFIMHYPVMIPTDEKIQQTLSDMLSSMDEEIIALEEEKDKMLQIKAGAMDDLLTGRIRLTRQGG